jgi:small-conductance mechanosensitive channel
MKELISNNIIEWSIVAFSAFLGFAVKDLIQNFFLGLQFLWGHDFDVDDIVYIQGNKKARIVRQSLWKTTFYVFPHQRKFIVPNSLLWKLNIEKQLPLNKETQ